MNRSLSILVLLVLAMAGTAAPAPLPKPTRNNDAPPSAERLAQILLAQHNIHADKIQSHGPNRWLIVGNTPMFAYDQVVYSQRVYIVSYTGPDRSGKPQLTVSDLTRARMAITR